MNALTETLNNIEFPSVVLSFMLIVGLLALNQIQKRPDYDLGDAIKDETGKVSMSRIGELLAIIISSWVLVALVMDAIKTTEDMSMVFKFFVAYLIVWSGAKTVDKGLDILKAKYAPVLVQMPAAKEPPAPPNAP